MAEHSSKLTQDIQRSSAQNFLEYFEGKIFLSRGTTYNLITPDANTFRYLKKSTYTQRSPLKPPYKIDFELPSFYYISNKGELRHIHGTQDTVLSIGWNKEEIRTLHIFKSEGKFYSVHTDHFGNLTVRKNSLYKDKDEIVAERHFEEGQEYKKYTHDIAMFLLIEADIEKGYSSTFDYIARSIAAEFTTLKDLTATELSSTPFYKSSGNNGRIGPMEYIQGHVVFRKFVDRDKEVTTLKNIISAHYHYDRLFYWEEKESCNIQRLYARTPDGNNVLWNSFEGPVKDITFVRSGVTLITILEDFNGDSFVIPIVTASNIDFENEKSIYYN